MSDKFKQRWGRLPKRLQATYLLIILVVVIGITTFLTLLFTGQINPQAATGQASLSITSGSQNYNVGTIFPLYIQLGADKNEQITKIQIASLDYDPSLIEAQRVDGVLQVITEPLTNLQAHVNSIEVNGAGEQTGRINLTLESPDGAYYKGGSARLAIINFKVLRSGQALFSFDPYNASSGTGAYIMNSLGSNILISAATGSILVGEVQNSPSPDLTPVPTPTPESQTTSSTTTTRTKKTPTPIASVTPTDITSATPELVNDLATPEPEAIQISGFSSTISILIYVGIAVVLTLAAFLVWLFQKRKKAKGGKVDDDDDELI
jgi:hypothetical protein